MNYLSITANFTNFEVVCVYVDLCSRTYLYAAWLNFQIISHFFSLFPVLLDSVIELFGIEWKYTLHRLDRVFNLGLSRHYLSYLPRRSQRLAAPNIHMKSNIAWYEGVVMHKKTKVYHASLMGFFQEDGWSLFPSNCVWSTDKKLN
jgi:hypothetical protein